MPAVWEVRASCFTPGHRFKVRVWQEWAIKPDTDAREVIEDALKEHVQSYWYSTKTPDPSDLVEYLVDTQQFDCVEVTRTDDDCGVSGYRSWP